jgi:[calcium/calmodulin-dependent protein kinase] kinase
MKAAKQFKRLILRKRPDLVEGIFGRGSKIVQPPLSMKQPIARAQSDNSSDRQPAEAALASKGIHRQIDISDDLQRLPESMDSVIGAERPVPASSPTTMSKWAQRFKAKSPSPLAKASSSGTESSHSDIPKGQAHDPLEDQLYLNVGSGAEDHVLSDSPETPVVSESPGAVDINVYEKAYEEEIQRILNERKTKPTLYLTRRVEGAKHLRGQEHITNFSRVAATAVPMLGFSKLVDMAKSHVEAERDSDESSDADRAPEAQ